MSLVETWNAQHKERLARIANAASTPKAKARPVTYTIPVLSPYEARPVPEPPTISEEWIRRQRAKHPEFMPFPSTRAPTVEHVQRAVAQHFGLRQFELISERRPKYIAIPRQVAVYLCRMLTPKSLPEIGRRFGGRDHTTILHAIRHVEKLLATDMHISASVEMLIEQLGGQPE